MHCPDCDVDLKYDPAHCYSYCPKCKRGVTDEQLVKYGELGEAWGYDYGDEEEDRDRERGKERAV